MQVFLEKTAFGGFTAGERSVLSETEDVRAGVEAYVLKTASAEEMLAAIRGAEEPVQPNGVE